MKITKRHLNVLGLFFSALIFFQGCTVYKSTPVSIEQAIQNESKVKVITKSNERLKFNKIGIEDGKFYGEKQSKGLIVKTPLNENFINKINEKDKTWSTIISIGMPLVIVFGVLAIVQPGNVKK